MAISDETSLPTLLLDIALSSYTVLTLVPQARYDSIVSPLLVPSTSGLE